MSRGFLGLAGRRRVFVGGIAEVRGPAACLRRDAVFRRLLLVADVVAIVGASVSLTLRSAFEAADEQRRSALVRQFRAEFAARRTMRERRT